MDFKICAIGCGGIANSVHGPAYQRFAERYPQAQLAACCDKDGEKAAGFAAKFGFKTYYTDMHAMLQTEAPAAVCLSVPAHLTAGIAAAVLKQGYPLLMEKPPGLNREETLAIMRAAAESGTPNMVAFNRRHMPVIVELKRLLSLEHRPEDLHSIQYDLYRSNRRDADFAETAIHAIDTVRYLAGSDYAHIAFQYQELPGAGPGVANIFMVCRMVSGATARLNICPVAGITMERAAVSVLNSTYFAEFPVWNSVDFPGRIRCFVKDKPVIGVGGEDLHESPDMSVTNGFFQENEAFFLDIMAGREPPGNVAAALQSVEIADCIRHRATEYRRE
jgi:predicted dehydrogenase